MERKGRAFTLIELLMVMLIIGIMIAMLMSIGPSVSRAIKVHQTQNFIDVLGIGIQRYKRIYGAFPTPGMSCPSEGWTGNRYAGKSAAFGLYLALQGPGSYGWTRADHGVTAEFGPFLEAGASNMGAWEVNWPAIGLKPVFIDSFNKGILYYKARINSKKPYRLPYDKGPYSVWSTSGGIWGNQTGIGGWQAGSMWKVYKDHFWKKLTVIEKDGHQYPYNPKSYILWSSGADEKFGYWVYDDEELGLQFDLKTGTCDDITNFD
ncbi:MAG: prepilin-type N-terminal cleavage/methylation domain-containing protein [Anaerolineaceae bacterium]|nr:prepilin-type N-terminal cleavage/methylation domain-containing protein [Anaerolineaceae bacterium]